MSYYQTPAAYLLHQPPLLLLEQVIAIDADSAHCQTRVTTDSVLVPFLTAQGELPNWYALELMAQTIGVWSGWHQQQLGATTIALAMLLGARELVCQQSVFPAGVVLDIHSKLLMQDNQFGSFEAKICCAGQLLAQGRVNTCQPDSATLQHLFAPPTNWKITS